MHRVEPFLDLHSHILPGVDHGSDSVETSLSLLKQAQKNNVGTIIATSHFYPDDDTVADFVKRREIGYTALMNAMKQSEIDIKIFKAAEVQLSPELPKIEGLERLAIEGTAYILIELPFTYWGNWIYDSLFEISAKRRLTPILAHIDRYPFEYVQKLLQSNYNIQINADTAKSRSDLKKYAEFVKSGKICFLGSDAHDVAERNYNNFQPAMQNLLALRKTFDADAKEILSLW